MNGMKFLVFPAFVILVLPGRAAAYLDAGSGSMIMQLLLGGLAGLAVILKMSWKWILVKLGIRKEEDISAD